VFSWSDKNGVPRESRGCTRDISPKGAYVIAAHCPPLGASVAMTFYLPSLTGESQTVHVQARSRVLRVDSSGPGRVMGFSVENERTTLCST
jgi:PilZ domain